MMVVTMVAETMTVKITMLLMLSYREDVDDRGIDTSVSSRQLFCVVNQLHALGCRQYPTQTQAGDWLHSLFISKVL